MSVLATVRVDPAKIPSFEVLEKACQLAGFSFVPTRQGTDVVRARVFQPGGFDGYARLADLTFQKRGEEMTVSYDTDYAEAQQKALTKMATWAQYVQDKQRVIDQGFTILRDTVDEWGNPVLAVEVVQEGGF